jgi:hypothetical protein
MYFTISDGFQQLIQLIACFLNLVARQNRKVSKPTRFTEIKYSRRPPDVISSPERQVIGEKLQMLSVHLADHPTQWKYDRRRAMYLTPEVVNSQRKPEVVITPKR